MADLDERKMELDRRVSELKERLRNADIGTKAEKKFGNPEGRGKIESSVNDAVKEIGRMDLGRVLDKMLGSIRNSDEWMERRDNPKCCRCGKTFHLPMPPTADMENMGIFSWLWFTRCHAQRRGWSAVENMKGNLVCAECILPDDLLLHVDDTGYDGIYEKYVEWCSKKEEDELKVIGL